MKKNTLWNIQLRLGIVMAIILAIGILFSIRNYQKEDGYAYYNRARILVKDQLETINQSFNDEIFVETIYEAKVKEQSINTYPFVITDTLGTIVYSNREGYVPSGTVNLNEFLQVDQSLYLNDRPNIKVSFVLLQDKITSGFAGFFVPRVEAVGKQESEVILSLFFPMILASTLILLLFLLYLIYMKRRMVLPVQEMIISSKAMMEGNYSVAVVKTKSSKLTSNEIDHLAFQFELMRDELKEKRRREEELNKSQKELISCISHDLKTPISTIKAYGEGLRDGMAKDPDKVQRYAEVIVTKAEVLTKMISDLLEHSNAELHQLSINKKEQYFNHYMDRVAKELEGLVVHHGMDFTYQNTAPNLLVTFDENRITQVIANLIDNSIKYSHTNADKSLSKNKSNGKIDLTVKYVAGEKQLYISVCDDGKGIGAMDIPFVFEKFYRGEKSRTMSISGSGLGLSICKYIIEEHGGAIWCESRLDKGTEFTISIPLL